MEAPAESPKEEQQPIRSYKRLWCAMASAIVPGAGDWILGEKRSGTLFLALFLAGLLCYWPLRLPRFYWPFILLVLAGQALNVISGCCTFLFHRSTKDVAANWWVLVLLALGLCSAPFERRIELRASGFQVFTWASESMSPTIEKGDYFVVDSWYFRNKKPQAGDVVAFNHRGVYLVKRVIVTGGGTIQGLDERVVINGQTVVEPYIVHRSSDHPLGELDTFGPYHVAEGEIFVMGDNRDFSLDSRYRTSEDDYGPVSVSDVVGRPLYRFRASMVHAAYDGSLVK